MTEHASTSPMADAVPAKPVPQRVGRPPNKAATAAEPQEADVPAGPGPRPVKRPLLGKRRKTLELDATRSGYVPRWINDEPGRIQYALECGYEHIRDEKKRPIFKVVDRHTGMKAYAMEIPQDLYDEAFAEKQQINDEIDRAIMTRPIADGGYRGGDGGTGQPATSVRVLRGQQPAGR